MGLLALLNQSTYVNAMESEEIEESNGIAFILVSNKEWPHHNAFKKKGEIYQTLEKVVSQPKVLKELINNNIKEEQDKITSIEKCSILKTEFIENNDPLESLLNNAKSLALQIRETKKTYKIVILITSGESDGGNTIGLASQLLNPQQNEIEYTIRLNNETTATYENLSKKGNDYNGAEKMNQLFSEMHKELTPSSTSRAINTQSKIDAVIVIGENNVNYYLNPSMISFFHHIALEDTPINKQLTKEDIQIVHNTALPEEQSYCNTCWASSKPALIALGKVLSIALPIIIELAIKGVL
jgi:hypothetical protein